MTSLTAYLSNAISTTLATSKQLYITSGTPSTTTASTTIGTATGSVELLNAAGSYAAITRLPNPDGKGWLLDATTLTLAGKTIPAGTWSGSVTLTAVQSGTPAGTLVGTIIVAVYKYSSTGIYTPIVYLMLTGQTITSTQTTYSLAASNGLATSFSTGDTLAMYAYVDITANANANVNQGIRLGNLSTDTSTFTGSANARVVSPGYVTSITPAPVIGPMSPSDLALQRAKIMASSSGPYLQAVATTYYGTPTNSQQVNGELDALFNGESLSQLHVMRTPGDVTSFLLGTKYIATVLQDSPVVQWRLNEALNSPVCYDFSGRKMTLTPVGGVTLGHAGPLTLSSDTAAQFDGSTGYLVAPLAVSTANWTALTVEIWIYLTSATFAQNARLISCSNTTSDTLGFDMWVAANAASVNLAIGNGSASVTATGAGLAAGTWYCIMGTYDGARIQLYAQGSVSGAAATQTGRIATTPYAITIGRNPATASNYSPFVMGQVSIYRTALTGARAAAHWNAGYNPT